MMSSSPFKPARSKLTGLLCALSSMLALSACQHRTTNQTITDWAHGLMGGEVYKLRPPPPGYDKPMPNINITPKYEPSFPSKEYRSALTENLQEHRNYAQRLSAASGPLPTTAPPPPPPPGNGENSSILSSTNSKGSSAPSRTAQQTAIDPTAAPTPAGKTPNADTDLPELKYHPVSHAVPHDLPAVGAPPPLPIGFGGFKVPPSPGAIRPDYNAKDPVGTLVRFADDTDQIGSGQDETLANLAYKGRNAQITITGFGTTLSADAGLQPEEQQHELTLGLLRAQAVAQALGKKGASFDHMVLQARPIGDGVRVQIQPMPVNYLRNRQDYDH